MNGTWETLFYSRTKLKLKQRTTMKNFKTCNLKQPFVPLAYNNYTYFKETISLEISQDLTLEAVKKHLFKY